MWAGIEELWVGNGGDATTPGLEGRREGIVPESQEERECSRSCLERRGSLEWPEGALDLTRVLPDCPTAKSNQRQRAVGCGCGLGGSALGAEDQWGKEERDLSGKQKVPAHRA